MMKNKFFKIVKKTGKGYTLIELLAVIMVLMAVGTIITVILVIALRGGSRSETVNSVRQSGDSAISQMSKMIAYASNFDQIIDTSGKPYKNCITSVPLKYSSVTITSFDGGLTTFSCDSSQQAIASQSADSATPIYLTDTNTTVVVANSCYFTCTQNSESVSPIIGIYFDLSTKSQVAGITPFVEKSTTIHFETMVALKNNP